MPDCLSRLGRELIGQPSHRIEVERLGQVQGGGMYRVDMGQGTG